MRVILDTDPSMGSPGSEIDDGFALALLAADDVFQLDLVMPPLRSPGAAIPGQGERARCTIRLPSRLCPARSC